MYNESNKLREKNDLKRNDRRGRFNPDGHFLFFLPFYKFSIEHQSRFDHHTSNKFNFVFCAAALLIIDRNVSHERAVCSGIPLSMISVYWAEVIH